VLAINLDTVLRLAEDQNAQIAGARARVEEAYAEKDLAATSWLPAVNVGTTFLRHEGGISNEDGRLTSSSFSALFAGMELNGKLDLKEAVFLKVNAERQLWQQKGDLRRITSETLLDAAGTYIDLLTTRTGEAIAVALQKDLEDLLGRAQKVARVEKGAEVEVARIQAQIKSGQRTIVELRQQSAQASAKLAYLLGVDPSATLVPVDERIVPLNLVDVSPPVGELVAQALANGPGVREMEGLLALIQESTERAKGPGRFVPVLEMRVLEGGYGTGPGDRMDWDNRLDLVLQARWNLTELLTAHDRQRAIQAKSEQAHWAYQDLRGKLTAGVQESREAIVSGREQIRLSEDQIREARRAHELSDKRLRNSVPGSSPSEVLLSLQSVSMAQLNYLNALRSYNRAQLRLLVVLGRVSRQPAPDGNCPMPGCKAQ
jgi:multidrug efflux system outer membrane protein